MKTKQILILWTVALFSVILLLPYLLETLEREKVLSGLPVAVPVFLLVSTLQSAVFLAIASFVGVRLARSGGIEISWAIESGKILYALIMGMVAGLIILSVDYFFHQVGIGPTFFSIDPVTPWKGMLASFYGGIAEEVLMRLFLVSLLVFLFMKLSRRLFYQNRILIFGIAIILVAILFGVGHLPAVQLHTVLTPMIIFRVILVNSIGGVVFGFLFIRYGLLYSMMAHFAADLLLFFIFPLLNN
jgi:hypothetical protein